MPDCHTQTDELLVENGPLTCAEMVLIHQMRRLQIRRAESARMEERIDHLDLIDFDGRTYLEMSKGMSPILVPTRMVAQVRESIYRHMEMRLDMVSTRGAPRQQYSPPQSPGYSGPPEPTYAQLQLTAASLPADGLALPAAQYMATALPHAFPQRDYSSSPWAYGAMSHPSTSAPSLLGAGGSSPEVLGMVLSPPSLTGMHLDDAAQGAQPGQHQIPLDTADAAPASRGARAAQPRRPKRAADDDNAKAAKGRARGRRAAQAVEEEEDESDGSGCLSSGAESEESTLRKPLNCFMLYRRHKNAELRKNRPGLSVDQASRIIKDYWHAESAEVKAIFKQQSNQEREQYFAKKKQHLARQKRKRTSRKAEGECGSLALASTRSLSSYAPEALAQATPRSPIDARMAALSHRPASTHSLTMDMSPSLGFDSEGAALPPGIGQFAADMGFGVRTSEAMPYLGVSSGIPAAGMTTADMNQRVASSLEQLQTSFSFSVQGQQQQQQHSALTAMALDSPVTTAAALQPLTAPAGIGGGSGMGWASSPGHNAWDSLGRN
ncbi:hypothetical protein IWQ57_000214 [Coemansia nantahalensis]|uniref:Uncharacterized protein n=1 Tax=Coemansia nantahalensis TaxID=2789366 RepID=A0ACC1K8Y9_9FUNG|nr:hypothetical protein IWQ57_000214 [Coemansia nantahalensis]